MAARVLIITLGAAAFLAAASSTFAAQRDWPGFWRGRSDTSSAKLLDDAYRRFAMHQPDLAVYDRAATQLETRLDGLPDSSDKLEKLRRGRAWIFAGELLAAQRKFAEAARAEAHGLALMEASLPAQSRELATTLRSHGNTRYLLGQFDQALLLFQRSLAIDEKLLGPWHPAVATDLNNLALMYESTGQYPQALHLYQRSLAINEKTHGPKHATVATSLNNLGALYHAMGQNDAALRLLQRSLAIEEIAHGPKDLTVATAANNLGAIYDALGQYDRALPLYQRSLKIYETVRGPQHPDVATALSNLGGLYQGMGQYAEALRCYQRSLEIEEARPGPLHPNLARSLSNLGGLYRAMGEYEKAVPLLRRGLTVYETALGAEHPFVATSLSVLGALYQSMGQYAQALPLFQRSLTIREKALGPEHPDVAIALNNLASLYESAGQYSTALPLYQRSVAISERAQGAEHRAVGVTLHNLGGLHMAIGEYAKALPIFQRSLTILERALGPEHPDVAQSLNNLGLLYRTLGQYAQALPLFQRSLAIREKALGAEHPAVAESLSNLGLLYQDMGQFAQALPLFQRSLTIREKALGPEHPDVANSVNNLALLYWGRGELAQALPLFERSLAIDEKAFGPIHPEVALALHNLAGLFQAQGQYQRALPLYRRSLEIRENALGPEHPDVAHSLNSMAGLYQALGERDKALSLWLRAERIASQRGAPEVLWRAQGNLSWAYAHSQHPELAAFWGKQAVNTIQGLRAGLMTLTQEMQQSYLQGKRVAYTSLADLLITQGRIPEAQQVMRMLKEAEYFDFTRRDVASDPRRTPVPLSGVERAAHERFYAIRDQLGALAQQRDALQAKRKLGEASPAELERLGSIDLDLRAANAAFDDFVAGLEKLLVRRDASATGAKQVVDQIRASRNLVADLETAGRSTAALQYVVSEQRLHMILTTRSVQIAREVVVTSADLNRRVAAFREAVQNPGIDPRPLGRELYALLIEPVRKDLEAQGIDTLMLILDDALRYVPFAALVRDDHYLIERYRLAIYTEASRSRLARTRAADQPWTVAAMGTTHAVPALNLPELPAVRDELHGIVQADVMAGVVRLDGQFTRASLESSLSTPVLHIASHFQFVPGSDESFLLLGDGSQLTLHDVRVGMRFDDVDLLTLSACNTATGGGLRENGLEVEGLGMLAQQQGAKAVLATLWSVADASTGLLMRQFYRERQSHGLNKAEALRAAQLALLRGSMHGDQTSLEARGATRAGPTANTGTAKFVPDPNAPYAHPYYWAPFILMGNWL